MERPHGLPDFEAWREKAREALRRGLRPEHAQWDSSSLNLFSPESQGAPVEHPFAPREFLELAESVARARDEDRWDLLYRLIYRLNHGERHLLNDSVDPDVHRAETLAKSVRRDIHKMHAFVRFKRAPGPKEHYVAWHRPEHLILELAAPFFVRRFGDKPWSIWTPEASAHWDLSKLQFDRGIPQSEFQLQDPFDEVWKTYYKSIYNPARLKIKMMKSELSPKYWESLPEASVIRDLIRDTPKRLQQMSASTKLLAKPPADASLTELRLRAKACRLCPFSERAHQTVFGEGPEGARLMIVGEQPGDQEDQQGRPFVGPAGELLEQALEKAGLRREELYLTNAVKHFKWTPSGPQGKTRLHQKASGEEMHACKPWLEAEIARVRPHVILALGVTAATSLYGRLVKIQEERIHPHLESALAPILMVSWHPSAILRASSRKEELSKMADLIGDLRAAAEAASATEVLSRSS